MVGGEMMIVIDPLKDQNLISNLKVNLKVWIFS